MTWRQRLSWGGSPVCTDRGGGCELVASERYPTWGLMAFGPSHGIWRAHTNACGVWA